MSRGGAGAGAGSVAGLLDDAFGDHVKIVTPWPQAARRRGLALFDREVVGDFVAQAPRLVEVDPSGLLCTQGWVLREHVSYYVSGEWERTGRTSADMHQRANRYPLLWPDDRGRLIILAGHHRSMAALIEKRPVLARVVGRPVDSPIAVTPTLFSTGDDAQSIRSDLLDRGLTPDEADERLRFAGLGGAV